MGDDFPLLMTEKDAVKCSFLLERESWCVAVDAHFSEAFFHKLRYLYEKTPFIFQKREQQ
jgi:tetraacyldisaccharide-1-P 4'-kinase